MKLRSKTLNKHQKDVKPHPKTLHKQKMLIVLKISVGFKYSTCTSHSFFWRVQCIPCTPRSAVGGVRGKRMESKLLNRKLLLWIFVTKNNNRGRAITVFHLKVKVFIRVASEEGELHIRVHIFVTKTFIYKWYLFIVGLHTCNASNISIL